MPSEPADDGVIVAATSGPLSGEVSVPGAKNSVLKLMAATLLADGEHVLRGAPVIGDVAMMADLLRATGLAVEFSPSSGATTGQTVRVRNTGSVTPVVPFELADRIRASVNLVGPLLGRFGEVEIALPGGDDFGGRPVDMHLRALESMGAEFTVTPGGISGRCDRLAGAEIDLDFPSVGATENILMAAVTAEGVTVIRNAAREPEIVDLVSMLRRMGARIEGEGTPTVRVTGVGPDSLGAVTHEVVADRVQAATYAAAVAMCGGEVTLVGAVPGHMGMLIDRFSAMGVRFTALEGGLRVSCDSRLSPVDVSTLPYPGFATDYKPLVVAMLAVSTGTGIVTENLYPGRFRYVEELRRLGARIEIDGHHAVVRGTERLTGATVNAPDIRAGAALVVAGLAAGGITEIRDVHHIDRGYDDLVGRLAGIGASVSRLGPPRGE